MVTGIHTHTHTEQDGKGWRDLLNLLVYSQPQQGWASQMPGAPPKLPAWVTYSTAFSGS